MKRIISAVLSCVILAGALVGCGYNSTAEEREPVFLVLGYDVPYELYRFYAMTEKESRGLIDENGNTRTDDPELLAKAEEAAMGAIYNLYAALVIGERMGLFLTDQVVSRAAEEYFEQIKNSYESESDFRADMKSVYMNRSVVELIYAAQYIQAEAYEKAEENGTLDDSEEGLNAFYASDNLIRVKHILIQPSLFTNAEEVAEIAYQKAKDATNFDTVFNLYASSGVYAEDRYMAKGETLEAFEEAAFALSVGELGPIVKTSVGYSIFMRYEKEADLVAKDDGEFMEKYLIWQFNLLLEEIKSKAEIEYYDAYDEHPFADIK